MMSNKKSFVFLTVASMFKNKYRIIPWLIWFLGALFYFYENLLQVSLGVMTKDLMSYFSIDETKLSVLASCYFYAYAFIQIPAGVLIDNYKIRNILLCAIFLCVSGCFLFLISANVFSAYVGRFFVGLGSGFAAISSMKLATNWFPPKKFPLLVSLMVTLGMTGSIVGEGPLSLLVDTIGWQKSILFLSFSGMILFVFVAFFVRENPSSFTEPREYKGGKIFDGAKEVLFCKKSWFLATYAGLMFAPTVIFGGLWGVPFITEFYGIEKTVTASIVSVLFLGWVIGSPVTGLLATYLNKNFVMLYGTLGALINIILVLYYRFESLNHLSLCLFLFGFFSSCFLPAFALIKDIHNSKNSGVALGFMNTANTLGGALGLSFIGFLFNIKWGNWLGSFVSPLLNYQIVLTILPIMLVVSLFLAFFFQKEKRPKQESLSFCAED